MDSGTLTERAAGAGLRPPRMLTLAITGSCNLKCQHCWVSAEPAAQRHVPVEKVLRIVEDFAALGGEGICLTGGEPLSHPQWHAILASCCSQPSFKSVGIQTNGALLGGSHVAILEKVQPGKLSIQVSLDGGSPRTHDRVRGQGSFARTMAGMARLAAAGLSGQVSVAFTEMRHNMDDVPELLELVDRLGVQLRNGGTLTKHGRAVQAGVEPPTPAQYQELLARYHADPRFRSLYDRRGKMAAIEWWKGRSDVRGDPCTFLEHPYITAEGVIYPCVLCHADEFAVDRAFERPLSASLAEGAPRWSRLLQLSRARPASLAECQGCAGRFHCAGGCMGRAHAACGDLGAVEDRCELRKAVYGWREDGRAALVQLVPSKTGT